MLINPAWAQGSGAAAPGGGIESMLLIVLMFVVLLLRPRGLLGERIEKFE